MPELAESLINDGTALVVYGLAVEAATVEHRLGPMAMAFGTRRSAISVLWTDG